MPDAIIFDLDDTLVMYGKSTTTVWEAAIARYIDKMGGLDVKTVNAAIRAAADWYWSDLERHREGRLDLVKARRMLACMAFERLGRTDFDLAERIADDYSEERDTSGILVAGAKKLLKDLRGRGIRLGMITNGGSATQRAKIEKAGLASYFDNILIEGEYICGKPDERVFKHTLEKLKVKAKDAWMVGDDMRFDIAPCRPLGIYTLWVDGNGDDSHKIEGVNPDKTIHSITEIPGLL